MLHASDIRHQNITIFAAVHNCDSVGCSSYIFNCTDTFSEFLAQYLDFSDTLYWLRKSSGVQSYVIIANITIIS